MVLLWLSLPVETVAILGHVALAVVGAAFGGFFVLMVEAERRILRLREEQALEPARTAEESA
jgi:hypothetical protein